jgi:hypothetical protein
MARKRVDDDAVVLTGVMQLVERLHGGVLVRSDKRIGDSLIERIAQNALRGGAIR